MNPYMNYLLPQLRIVVKLFKEMTPQQKASLLRDNHLIFYNFEDVVQLMDTLDDNVRRDRQELEAVKARLTALDE